MNGIIAQLYSEHSNMAKLLNVLDRQVAIFDRGGGPDYEIVQAVMGYFLDYPELCHHPKEDMIARRLQELTEETTQLTRKLEAQHEELGQLTQRFAKIVVRVLDEAELPRAHFVRAAREFIESQRHHMRMEEEHFFPYAESRLGDDDLAELNRALFLRQDPLFGPKVEQEYATLSERILQWEKANQTR